jgi:hypothetical protein
LWHAQIKALVDGATAGGLERFQARFDRVFALSSQTKGYKGCVHMMPLRQPA